MSDTAKRILIYLDTGEVRWMWNWALNEPNAAQQNHSPTQGESSCAKSAGAAPDGDKAAPDDKRDALLRQCEQFISDVRYDTMKYGGGPLLTEIKVALASQRK